MRTIISDRIGDSETNMRSEADFERTYRANVRAVYGYAATRVGRSEAEDVAAEVFQAAAVAFADGRAEQVTLAWLMTVARNKVIDRWRRTERHTLRAHGGTDIASVSANSAFWFFDTEHGVYLVNALGDKDLEASMSMVSSIIPTMQLVDGLCG